MLTYTLDLPDQFLSFDVIEFNGKESISQDYLFSITFRTPASSEFDPSISIHTKASLNIHSPNKIIYEGIILSVSEEFSSDIEWKTFNLELGSVLSSHKHNEINNIFVDKRPTEILTEVLDRDFLVNYHFSCTQVYPKKVFIHQYKESNFDFFSRLCEHWGIYYYFDRLDNNNLVLADDTNYLELETNYIYNNQPQDKDVHRSIRSLKHLTQSSVQGVEVFGRNPESSTQTILGTAGITADKNTTVSVNGVGVDNQEEADTLAQIRLEQLIAETEVYEGSGNALGIFPGFVMNLMLPGQTTSKALLITKVTIKGIQPQQSQHSQLSNFECSFVAIPADQQYRPKRMTREPKAISSTARIHSDYEDMSSSHRDEWGRYKVVFDFLEDERVSHWIRKSQSTAKDNHMDMVLLPDTEVQIGYLGGNPDLPYIVSAIENSQSSDIPGTAATPLLSSISTTGTLQLKAKRSVSQSFQAPMDKSQANNPNSASGTTPFNAPITDYYQLNNFGEKHSSGNKLEESSKEYNLSHYEGQSYAVSDSIDFYLGDSQKFYFGNQYREYHSENNDSKFIDNADKYQFPDSIFFNDDKTQATKQNVAKEKQVGIVRKIFGNRYNHHNGHISTIFKADNEQHKTLNYGPRYIENIINDATKPDNSITKGFPDDRQPTVDDQVTRTRLNQYRMYEGHTVTVQNGNTYVKRTGDTERIQQGGMSKVTINGTSREKYITVSGDSTKNITANTVSVSIDSNIVKKTISGNRHQHIFGSDNSMVLGSKNSLVVGPTVNVEAVSSSKVIGGFKMELIFGPSLKYMLYPETKRGTFNDEEFAVHRQNAATALCTVGTAISKSAMQIGRSQLFILNPSIALVG